MGGEGAKKNLKGGEGGLGGGGPISRAAVSRPGGFGVLGELKLCVVRVSCFVFLCLFACLCVCVFVCLFVVCVFLCSLFSLLACLLVCLFVCLSVCLSVC